LKSKLINILCVFVIAILLFIFECSQPQYYGLELLWSLAVSASLWGGNILIINGLNHYLPWRQPAAPRVFIQTSISVLFTIWLAYFAANYLYSDVYHSHFSSVAFRKNLFVFLTISILYNAIYTGSHFFRKWRGTIVETEELKRQNLISQYESLKNQINPHFLFNSINTMIGLIDEDPKLAKEYGYKFAEIYRQILIKGQEELISLKEELEIVETQRLLFKSRFGDGLIFDLNIPDEVHNLRIPPLTLQMLIENAVKHNSISEKHPLTIKIIAEHNQLIVSNNIQVKNLKSESTRMGIENIRNRYRYIANEEIEVINDGQYFTVKLPLLSAEK